MTRTAARLTSTLFGAATLIASAAIVAGPASADTAPECPDGVLVVVDFTDLGGEVETGCAEGDPESGRAALEAAGFTPEDSSPGLICTIDGQPDPCPTEFDGNYWAYWQVVDGEWEASMIGADEADPAPGGIEGWRYNDGSVPPPLPAAGGEASDDTATSDPATDDTTSDDAATSDSDDSGGISPALWIVIGVVVVAIVVGAVVRVTGARAERAAGPEQKGGDAATKE
ncbi:hypothetical protein [Pseudactinotalea sp.]|uniref:hypothetical protein n=1 Tax=Pseudactinotalea sp. TaxID=1926260 RepID=UPI003B3A8003